MGQLIYSMIMSLDGYTADAKGAFDWAAPDPEVHAFANDLERQVGTHLYGREMYETMVFWETAHTHPDAPSFIREYAELWQQTDKVVYSTTLAETSSARTRIERSFDPHAVRALVSASDQDVSIGGPHLAARAITAGLVDEYHLLIVPFVVGGGTRALPDNARLRLELLDERRFTQGTVYVRYGAKG